MTRLCLALAGVALCLGAAAQSTPRPLPPGVVPLEDIGPPPRIGETAAVLEPQVTIRQEAERTVAEYRVNGRLYMMLAPNAGADNTFDYCLRFLKGE